MLNFIKNYWKTIGFILVFPFILDWILRFIWWIPIPIKESAPLSEWLGFLAAYFGVIGAIGGIWWQIYKEKKEKEKEVFESQKNALMSFLYLTQNTAKKYHDFSEAFITLLKKDSNFKDISYKTFEYNKTLYNDLIFKVPPKFQETILKTMNKFDDFLLKDYLRKSKANEELLAFLNEEKKIYKKIYKKIKSLISKLSKTPDETFFNEAETKLDFIVKKIEKIEKIKN